MFGLNNIFAIKYPFFIMPVNEIKKRFFRKPKTLSLKGVLLYCAMIMPCWVVSFFQA
jgi:hypothetical protein